jgi:hypothetical protein
MPPKRPVDIDTMFEWLLVEFLMSKSLWIKYWLLVPMVSLDLI